MKYLILLLFPVLAFAQSGSVKFDMPWSPQVVPAFTIIPVRTSTTGVISEIPGQAQPINLTVAFLKPNVQIVVFPGQKSSAMVISGFRIKGAVKASWTTDVTPTQMLPNSIIVPAGKGLTVRVTYSLTDTTGTFEWAPDVLSLGTPQPTPTPVPVVPPVASGCIRMPPAPNLTDSTGVIWSLGPVWTADVPGSDTKKGQFPLIKNGLQLFQGIDYAYLTSNGLLCVVDTLSPGPQGILMCGAGSLIAIVGPVGC